MSAWDELRIQGSTTGLTAHDLVTQGFPGGDARALLEALTYIDEASLCIVLDTSLRRFHLRLKRSNMRLTCGESDALMRFLSTMNMAIQVLGSQFEAEKWLSEPPIGMNQRKPLDLLRSTEGTKMVQLLLSRMEYGVYA